MELSEICKRNRGMTSISRTFSWPIQDRCLVKKKINWSLEKEIFLGNVMMKG